MSAAFAVFVLLQGPPPSVDVSPPPPPPEPAFAVLVGKDAVRVRVLVSSGVMPRETTGCFKDDKGELIPRVVKYSRHTITETSVTVPLKIVQGFDVEGKPIESAKTAEMLAKERPVVVFAAEPKADDLKLYRADMLILLVPVEIAPSFGYSYTVPQPGPVPVPLPGPAPKGGPSS